MNSLRLLVSVFGLVLGPAMAWWGAFFVFGLGDPGRMTPAELATAWVFGAGAVLLIVAGLYWFVVAAVLALRPVARWIERELTL